MKRRFNAPCDWPMIPFGAKVEFLSYSRSSASLWLKGLSWNIHWIRFEHGERSEWLSFDCGYGGHANSSTTRNLCKKIQIKEADFIKRNTEFFPCRTGENLQDGQPSSTTVYKAEGNFMK